MAIAIATQPTSQKDYQVTLQFLPVVPRLAIGSYCLHQHINQLEIISIHISYIHYFTSQLTDSQLALYHLHSQLAMRKGLSLAQTKLTAHFCWCTVKQQKLQTTKVQVILGHTLVSLNYCKINLGSYVVNQLQLVN